MWTGTPREVSRRLPSWVAGADRAWLACRQPEYPEDDIVGHHQGRESQTESQATNSAEADLAQEATSADPML